MAAGEDNNSTNETSRPLVSVIIPVYNGQETICRAIDSVLGQSYRQREVIVVDDGSTDSSIELLRRYASEIRLVEQRNSGVSSARNHGIKLARGKYLAFLDQDDFWVQEKLAIQVDILKSHPSVGLTFSNLEDINEHGERLGFTTLPSHLRYAPSWEDLLLKGSLVLPSTMLCRREITLKVGGFDADLFICEDRDFCLRFRELTDFHYLDVCLGYRCYNKAHALLHLTKRPLFAQKYWNHPRLMRDPDGRLRDRFVANRTQDMIWRMRLLPESEDGRIRMEMLERINGVHETFKGIFGESYKRVSHFDSIDLNRYELNAGVSVLLYLYLCRADLQVAFPEVHGGDISRLASWGVAVAKGVCDDTEKPILLPHVRELERLRLKRVSYIHALVKRLIRQAFLADSSA